MEIPLPEIKLQDLGHRPRLTSIDDTELNEHISDDDSNQSTDEPIACLTQLDINQYKSHQCSVLTTKNCNYEHESIGFIPLSHTICTEGCSSSCCSDFSIDNEHGCIPHFEESSISEDAAVSLYKISCEKMNKIKLFEDLQDININSLQDSLRRMQLTLEMM